MRLDNRGTEDQPPVHHALGEGSPIAHSEMEAELLAKIVELYGRSSGTHGTPKAFDKLIRRVSTPSESAGLASFVKTTAPCYRDGRGTPQDYQLVGVAACES